MAWRVEPLEDPAELVAFEAKQGTPRSAPEVERRVHADPEGTFVARDDAGNVLGCGSVIVHRDAGEGAYAFVGGMIVDPAQRRQGIARALLRAGLARADALGAQRVALAASAMGRPLYESEGFRALATTVRYERQGPPRAPTLATRTASVYPISSCEIMDLLKFDAPRFGASRAPFLADLLGTFPERAFVAFDRASGAIAGFVGTQERVVGPLVADSDEVAARLLHAAELAGAPPKLLLSGLHARAQRLAEGAGYAPDGHACTLMLRGDRLPGRPDAIWGLGAWAIG